jgi:hypothetical protein
VRVQVSHPYKVLVGNLKGKKLLEDLGADGSAVLRLILKEYDRKGWI